MKKPPTALAGGGLGIAYLEKPVRQATFPARAMEMLIRIAGIDTAMQATIEKPELAQGVCITFFSRAERLGSRQGSSAMDDVTPKSQIRQCHQLQIFHVSDFS
jgi:hypothetical protein